MSGDGSSPRRRRAEASSHALGTPGVVRRPSVPTALLVSLGAVGVAASFTAPVAAAGFTATVATLAGTALVAGLLNHLLVSGRELPPAVTESVYTAFASAAENVVAERGLSEHRVYVPASGRSSARLVVPATSADPLQRDWGADDAVGPDDAVFTPTGEPLYRSFRRTRPPADATDPERTLSRLGDALDNGFELVDGVAVTAEDGEAAVSFEACVLPDADRIDHPVPSFLAVGFAREFGRPVVVDSVRSDTDGSGTVVLRW
ncbi:hypothetical protein GJ631_09695 [Natronomonas sp. CBA1123]|uniref:hypothetical protein n=1 Tax=Natronomonas sp. CBA1123 TaxID=2668070 RepID=UPI0012EA61D6|nr:hypothetical protein [Natronomonas sp. CBA1123]MUV86830.1 hypothetical protein [Natronomonas sp. CBA1123]